MSVVIGSPGGCHARASGDTKDDPIKIDIDEAVMLYVMNNTTGEGYKQSMVDLTCLEEPAEDQPWPMLNFGLVFLQKFESLGYGGGSDYVAMSNRGSNNTIAGPKRNEENEYIRNMLDIGEVLHVKRNGVDIYLGVGVKPEGWLDAA
jgi:hypothetical protein